MTGTFSPARPRPEGAATPPAAGRGRGDPPRPAPSGRRDDPTAPSTMALTILTLSVAAGFGRLFDDAGFLAPVLVAAVATHGTAWWCRRRGLTTGVGAAASVITVALVGSWTVLGHTTAYGLPLPVTLRTALDVLGDARQMFSTVTAPAGVLPGFVLATVVAVGVTAFMADWAAFRLQATFEAIIPALTLLLFTAALGTPRHRSWAIALFVAAVLGFVVSQQLGRSSRSSAWFDGQARAGPATVVKAAMLLGTVALVAGLVVGPRIPAPERAPIKYKNRGGTGPANRATVSPLVDIRGRIVDQRDIEFFTVEADQPSYWRLTSLDTFDGNIWSSNSTYVDTDGRVRSDEILQPTLGTEILVQEYSVSGLASIWLPAAFRPQHLSGVDVSYASDSSSLITPQDTTDGTTYTVRSAVPKMTPALLNRAPAAAPAEILDRYLALPQIPPRVVAEARRIVAGSSTPYQRALALQNHFKDNYRYDINAGKGHDERTLETFLFRDKAGYCEQFAGTYAVLGRLVGLPTRVAIGFTPGILDEKDGSFHVKGAQAHAWVEVYLHGYGWVQFDPTPGRGDPQASSYTGRPAAQDETTAEQPDLAAPTTVGPGGDNTETPTTEPVAGDGGAAPSTAPVPDRKRPAILVLVVVVAATVLASSAVVAAFRAYRRTRRWRRGPHVLAAWADVEETFERAGIHRRKAETMSEFSRRVGPSTGLHEEPASALHSLARSAAAVAYTDDEVDPETTTRSVAEARMVRDAVLRQLTWWTRIRWWIDPRAVLSRPRSG